MEKHYKILASGLVVSFLGALPFGTLNITAFHLSASQGVLSALWFSIAAIIVELIYVKLSLWGSDKIDLNRKWILYLIPFGSLLLLSLAALSFNRYMESDTLVPGLGQLAFLSSPILLGFMLSALNPLQVPFWVAWNKIFENKGILNRTNFSRSLYLIGIGLGTLAGMMVFIVVGRLLMDNYMAYAKTSSLLLGLLYLGFAVYLMVYFYKKQSQLKIR